MRQLTIDIPDNKFHFMIELLSNFKFVKINAPDNFVITEEQKKLANEEFKKMEDNPDYALDWDEVKDLLMRD